LLIKCQPSNFYSMDFDGIKKWRIEDKFFNKVLPKLTFVDTFQKEMEKYFFF
jgi:hypothetical protein